MAEISSMTDVERTYDLECLERSLTKWRESPALRGVYEDMFRDMMRTARDGPVLEVGSGIGVIKEVFPQVVTSDIKETGHVDREVSCYSIPRAAQPWSTILGLDVLHHLRRPLDFFSSAAKALDNGGRLVLMEPAATRFGRVFYRLCHHEPCRIAGLEPPFDFAPDDDSGHFANMAMAVALFVVHREWLDRQLGNMGLRVVEVRFRDILAYPLTGGFSRRQFLPAPTIRFLLRVEKKLPQAILRHCGLRVRVVMEKNRD